MTKLNYQLEVYDPGTETWVTLEYIIGLTCAINRLRTQVLNSEQQYRLTSPKLDALVPA